MSERQKRLLYSISVSVLALGVLSTVAIRSWPSAGKGKIRLPIWQSKGSFRSALRERFDRITNGMTKREVYALMGETPGSEEPAPGSRNAQVQWTPPFREFVETWRCEAKDKTLVAEIMVAFDAQGRVNWKSFSPPDDGAEGAEHP